MIVWWGNKWCHPKRTSICDLYAWINPNGTSICNLYAQASQCMQILRNNLHSSCPKGLKGRWCLMNDATIQVTSGEKSELRKERWLLRLLQDTFTTDRHYWTFPNLDWVLGSLKIKLIEKSEIVWTCLLEHFRTQSECWVHKK